MAITLFANACRLSREGIASKRLDSTYRPGRSTHWVKIKNRNASARPKRIGGANAGANLRSGHHRHTHNGGDYSFRTRNPNRPLTRLRQNFSRPRLLVASHGYHHGDHEPGNQDSEHNIIKGCHRIAAKKKAAR